MTIRLRHIIPANGRHAFCSSANSAILCGPFANLEVDPFTPGLNRVMVNLSLWVRDELRLGGHPGDRLKPVLFHLLRARGSRALGAARRESSVEKVPACGDVDAAECGAGTC